MRLKIDQVMLRDSIDLLDTDYLLRMSTGYNFDEIKNWNGDGDDDVIKTMVSFVSILLCSLSAQLLVINFNEIKRGMVKTMIMLSRLC
jgi:hypothetical protein